MKNLEKSDFTIWEVTNALIFAVPNKFTVSTHYWTCQISDVYTIYFSTVCVARNI